MLDERMVDEYNQVYEWYGPAVVLRLYIDVDSRGREKQIYFFGRRETYKFIFLVAERDTNLFFCSERETQRTGGG